MNLYFSPSTGGFYSEAIHGKRGGASGCLIPLDAVEISRETHAELMVAQAAGKIIVASEAGPVAVDPVMTRDQIVSQNRTQRDRLLASSDWTQMPDALGSEPEYKAAMAVWRQELRDLDLVDGIFPDQPQR